MKSGPAPAAKEASADGAVRAVPARSAGSVLTLVLTLMLAACAGSATAQNIATTVRLDGQALFRVSPGNGETADARRDKIESRLEALVRDEVDLPPAIVSPSSSGLAITVAGVPILAVTQEDADDNLTSPAVLADRWARAISAEFPEARKRRLGLFGSFGAETRGVFETALSRLGESSLQVVPAIVAALCVVGLFTAVAWGMDLAIRRVLDRAVSDRTLKNLVRQLGFYSVVLLGIVVAADALGFSPQSLVTGLGLTGLVLGFALKDILSNFVSGILILATRPFRIGDQIVVGATEGAVEQIELRATQIRTYDGRVALLPNAEVFTSRIVNNTADPIRRGNVRVAVGYGPHLPPLMDALSKGAAGVEGVLPEKPVSVRVDDLGPSDIILDIGFWTDSRRSDFQDTTSRVRLRVLATLVECGIDLPQPDLRRVVFLDPDASP